MSKFPEKLFCNITENVVKGEDRNVWAYENIETAAEGEAAIRVGVYHLVEVLEVRAVTRVEAVKVEN